MAITRPLKGRILRLILGWGQRLHRVRDRLPPNSPVRSLSTPISAALAENRTVQAAYHNVQSLKYRIPQVTALEDPVASNTVFPIPSVAPQYSLMGYNPYNLTIAQQFPWFGTLRLRGEVAEKDVQIAVVELVAAQLDTITAVKRAYYDLYSNQKTAEILADTRTILDVFRSVAASRLKAGGAEQDVIKAEVLISELDRDLASYQQAISTARAAMARQIHVNPDSDLGTLPQVTLADVPMEVDPLYQMALAIRPELRGRLESIARDEKAEQLAQKRALPNVTLGLTYMDMTRQNAVSPTASGSPNVGLFVAFNLPVNQAKYRAGVLEARSAPLRTPSCSKPSRTRRSARSTTCSCKRRSSETSSICCAIRSCLAPRKRWSWPRATTPGVMSTSQRCSRPSGKSSRSRSRSPRSRPSSARRWRCWNAPWVAI